MSDCIVISNLESVSFPQKVGDMLVTLQAITQINSRLIEYYIGSEEISNGFVDTTVESFNLACLCIMHIGRL